MARFSRRSILVGLPILIKVSGGRDPMAAQAASPVVEKRLALSGYDPVSYFTEGHPEKGSAEYSATFDDATYWFKSAEHRMLFVNDPDHYAPQFGGHCTIMVSRGEKYEADPEAWTIADGKLYVFSDKKGVPFFEQQTASIVEKAAKNWPELRNRP
jgi:YHS domain-containing protein